MVRGCFVEIVGGWKVFVGGQKLLCDVRWWSTVATGVDFEGGFQQREEDDGGRGRGFQQREEIDRGRGPPIWFSAAENYLPDGDIDLTIICHPDIEEDLAVHMCNFFAREDQKDSQFALKDVEYVRGKVRVVKCSVRCIAVDISFNQIAGLRALCFLDQIDQLVGKDHLFKRSIILVKAWCYYESRLLGARHGLIATYTLNVLVLHIVNLFHSSLNGPLQVLHRFLDYYSEFDWEKYCICLNGRVTISSFPELVVETPQNDGSNFLFGHEFLKDKTGISPISNWAREAGDQAFTLKHLNIIDPLKDNNNLGRSVNEAIFYRMKSAFSYGARKLGDIIMLPQESIGAGLQKFFVNTLHWNGNGRRPVVRIPLSAFGSEIHEASDLIRDYDLYLSNLAYGEQYHDESHMQSNPPLPPLQINNNLVSQANMEGFVPKAVQPSTSMDERLTSQAMDVCIPNIELRGKGTLIPDFHVQGMFMSQETARLVHRMDGEEKMKSRGTGTFIPNVSVNERYKSQGVTTITSKVGVEENFQLGGPSSCIPNVGVEENLKSQGSTQSSDLRKIPCKRRSKDLLLKSSLKNEKGGVSLKMEEKSSSTFDLSVEEFPLLPGAKNAIPSICLQPNKPIVEAPQAQKSSPVSENTELGFFEPSLPPSVLSSLVTGKGSGPAESSGNKKEIVLAQPYRLEDDEDFPSLGK
ncbi:hypothetical protein Vadar_010920 [Vaccinium darrowii]|uniref:Uncharacterized protein n=1 Tax=Vaccinium darrowii TaxID=229202 RepID=A0ACB7YKR3_9ERIC|nr:hypothetical protein Vadar_010920 [Vaccinium darrowii]